MSDIVLSLEDAAMNKIRLHFHKAHIPVGGEGNL